MKAIFPQREWKSHDDVMKWKHFPRYWPFVRGIHRSPVNSLQRPVTRSFDVFIDLRLNKRWSKQSWGWPFETPLRPLWRHCNGKHRFPTEQLTSVEWTDWGQQISITSWIWSSEYVITYHRKAECCFWSMSWFHLNHDSKRFPGIDQG